MQLATQTLVVFIDVRGKKYFASFVRTCVGSFVRDAFANKRFGMQKK